MPGGGRRPSVCPPSTLSGQWSMVLTLCSGSQVGSGQGGIFKAPVMRRGDRRRPWILPGNAIPLHFGVHDSPYTMEARAPPLARNSPVVNSHSAPRGGAGLDPVCSLCVPQLAPHRCVCWGLAFFGSHTSLVPHFLLITVNVSHLKRQQPPPQRRRVPLSLERTLVSFLGLAFAQLLYLNTVV